MCAELGVPAVAALLSEPEWLIKGWFAGSAIRARDKKLIWLVHSLLYNPSLASSPFHIATFGRFWRHPYGDPADVTCAPEAAKHRAKNYAKLAKRRVKKA
jgi:hypothetical protein